MKLIVGLGNPGKEYEETRHNAGFRFIDTYAKEKGLTFDKKKFGGLYTQFNYNNEKIILLKPCKFINLSGEVIYNFLNFFKISKENLLVIVDDMDTDMGRVKIKQKGSSAGHNGLKNIELHLKTNEYKRIKIGISRDASTDTVNYVIGRVSKGNLEKINSVNKYAVSIIDDYLNMPFDNLMNKYNRKKSEE